MRVSVIDFESQTVGLEVDSHKNNIFALKYWAPLSVRGRYRLLCIQSFRRQAPAFQKAVALYVHMSREQFALQAF